MLIDQWLAPLYSLHLVDVSIHFKFNLLPPKHCLAKQIIIIRSSVPWGMYEADLKAFDCSLSHGQGGRSWRASGARVCKFLRQKTPYFTIANFCQKNVVLQLQAFAALR